MVGLESSTEELSLRDYVEIVRRRKASVAVTMLLAVAAALVTSLLQTPVYATSAEVLLRQRSTEGIFESGVAQRTDPQRALQTEIRILRSVPIRESVREALGYDGSISARAAGQTDIILVTAEETDPQRAADVANAYVETYIKVKQAQIITEFLAAVDQIQAQIDDLQRQIESAATEGARSTLNQRKTNFEATRDELRLGAQIRTGGAQQVSRAEVPTNPVRPQPLRAVLIGFALGLVLGVGLALFIEFLDDTVKTKADMERVAASLPVLGLIPMVSTWRNKNESQLISLSDPTSPSAEAYRTLRTAVQFLGMDRPVQIAQLTSPSASEGKTTTLVNLGVAMARAGRRVILVCCDLRRPRLHEFFGISNDVGFTSVLLGEVNLSDALQKVPGVERLFVLPSGPLPPNPSELLSSRRAVELLNATRGDGNFVLLDSPPVLPVTDGLVLSKQVDATLLVSIAGGTTRKDAARAVELLRQVGAPLAGTILNGVTEEGTYGYGYGYYHSPVTVNGSGRDNGHGRTRRRLKALARRPG